MKKWIYPLSLIFLFFILITLTVPDEAVFGSQTDWLSQHATLAETIRNACLEQHTLLPSWIELGGGSNGYQFAYYGFLRPDILIGCLLPQVPMIHILTYYMLVIYLASVLLCYVWLRSENISPILSFIGSVLFTTAGCMFHMHRQVMFVNYLPYLLCALLCVRKKQIRWLPFCLCLICLSSFYFAIAAFSAVGWYWYRQDGNSFWKDSFLKKYIPCALTGAALSAALLIPTALVLLEHGRCGGKLTLLTFLELFGPNPALNNLLFNEYGLGVTFLCLYTILAGLAQKKFRKDSLLFLLFGIFGVFSWLLNGTLYARPKILIPFLPLVILHCVRYLRDIGFFAPKTAQHNISGESSDRCTLPLFPFAVIFPVGHTPRKPALVQPGTVSVDPGRSRNPLSARAFIQRLQTQSTPEENMAAHCREVRRTLPDSPPAPYLSCRDVSYHCRDRRLGQTFGYCPGLYGRRVKSSPDGSALSL